MTNVKFTDKTQMLKMRNFKIPTLYMTPVFPQYTTELNSSDNKGSKPRFKKTTNHFEGFFFQASLQKVERQNNQSKEKKNRR